MVDAQCQCAHPPASRCHLCRPPLDDGVEVRVRHEIASPRQPQHKASGGQCPATTLWQVRCSVSAQLTGGQVENVQRSLQQQVDAVWMQLDTEPQAAQSG